MPYYTVLEYSEARKLEAWKGMVDEAVLCFSGTGHSREENKYDYWSKNEMVDRIGGRWLKIAQ